MLIGTYGATTGLANDTDCSECTIGMYCETVGLTAPTGDCAAGYYCVQGETLPTVLKNGLLKVQYLKLNQSKTLKPGK